MGLFAPILNILSIPVKFMFLQVSLLSPRALESVTNGRGAGSKVKDLAIYILVMLLF